MDAGTKKHSDLEFTQRMIKLAEKEPEAVILFASRCALRVFPLLAKEGNLNHWDSQQERKLLAIWGILLVGLGRVSATLLPSSLLRSMEMFVSSTAIHVSNNMVASSAGAIAAAVNVAIGVSSNAEHSTMVSSDTNARFFANLAMSANSNALYAATYSNDIGDADDFTLSAVEKDLVFLQKNSLQDLSYQSIWHGVQPSSKVWEDIRHQKLPLVITELLKNISHSPSSSFVVEMLNNILPIYEQIEAGRINEELLTEQIEKLALLFNAVDDKTVIKPKKLRRKNKKGDSLGGKTAREKKPFSENIKSSEKYRKEVKEEGLVTNSIKYTTTTEQNPEKISREDFLNRQPLVDTLATILAQKSNQGQQTIGLLGDWGVGKSTVLGLLQQKLFKDHKEQPFLFANFNAWEYEHTDNLQAGIAQEMIKTLSSPEPKPKQFEREDWEHSAWDDLCWFPRRVWLVTRFAASLHRWALLKPLFLLLLTVFPLFFQSDTSFLAQLFPSAVDYREIGTIAWLGGFTYILFKQFQNILANPLAKEFLTYLKLPDYGHHLGHIPVMRENIKKLAKVRLEKFGKSKRLLYVVDDLDRCNHKNIIKVFEAVRLVLDIPQVVVIIAVDHRIALSALSEHYDAFSRHCARDSKSIARDYLSKMIHLPIRLSEPDPHSVEQYLASLWSKQEVIDKQQQPIENNEGGAALSLDTSNTTDNMNTDITNVTDLLQSDNDSDKQADNQLNQLIDKATQNAAEVVADLDNKNESAEDVTTKVADSPLEKTASVKALSETQKIAFRYWVDYFKLSNPRQLKRLDNSYHLVRHFYQVDMAPAGDILPEDVSAHDHYPVMTLLCALEFINELDTWSQRETVRDYLEGKPGSKSTQPTITKAIADLAQQEITSPLSGLSGVTLLQAIEPFVLPAIDVEEQA